MKAEHQSDVSPPLTPTDLLRRAPAEDWLKPAANQQRSQMQTPTEQVRGQKSEGVISAAGQSFSISSLA